MFNENDNVMKNEEEKEYFNNSPREEYAFINQRNDYQFNGLKGKKKRKIFLKLISILTGCLMVSATSIYGFIYFINAGYIEINNASTNPAFTINRVLNNEKTNTKGVNGELTLQEIAAKVIPSVVCIQNFKQNNRSMNLEPAGEGSGIIMTQDGYIITNAHVVKDATSLKVVLSDGKTYEAKLIGSDSSTDLALIKIDATNLTTAEFGDSSQLKVADTVVAIGNPGGLEFNSSVTVGYVSALGRSIETSAGYTMHAIQTDAAINPGNSGGALVNIYGQVIGINSSKIVASGFEGLGFAISINEAQPIISSLKTYGYVKDRAVIGIGYQMLNENSSKFYNLPVGMYIASVNSPNVTKAGIEKGDVITHIEGKKIESATDITSILKTKKPGDEINLTVYKTRTQETIKTNLVLSEYSGN